MALADCFLPSAGASQGVSRLHSRHPTAHTHAHAHTHTTHLHPSGHHPHLHALPLSHPHPHPHPHPHAHPLSHSHPHPHALARQPLAAPNPNPISNAHPNANAWTHKDYSQPLHVDCSVEYELPECAKPPQGVNVEPLLMIHPAHFRRLDSLRRCPFVNNLPAASAGDAFELPPPAASRRPCRRTRPSPERLQRLRANEAVQPACCQPLLQYASGAAGATAPPEPAAPKEGDTLENSSFVGKCAPAPRYHRRLRAHHPYHPLEPPPLDRDTALPPNCDKTFDALQGNPLISPFRAKMFSGESVYQNYPIVMYK
ncbi:uncharacterized protein LOC143918693 [Arctopsyche grandis]|uniref:uncharacterized protein LOC143918693 n=1 Tax=Arctopsyche grandis TaxID=121162 RepID=UPI00406D70FE